MHAAKGTTRPKSRIDNTIGTTSWRCTCQRSHRSAATFIVVLSWVVNVVVGIDIFTHNCSVTSCRCCSAATLRCTFLTVAWMYNFLLPYQWTQQFQIKWLQQTEPYLSCHVSECSVFCVLPTVFGTKEWFSTFLAKYSLMESTCIWITSISHIPWYLQLCHALQTQKGLSNNAYRFAVVSEIFPGGG